MSKEPWDKSFKQLLKDIKLSCFSEEDLATEFFYMRGWLDRGIVAYDIAREEYSKALSVGVKKKAKKITKRRSK